MELCSELQQVFESACQGLDCEEAQDLAGALNHYYLAKSRIRYVLEAILQPVLEQNTVDPEVAIVMEACRRLEATYDWGIQRLTTGPENELLAVTQLGCPQDGSFACNESQLESRGAGEGLKELRRLDDADIPADLLDIAKRCIREVQGSLEDVVGLSSIKQELREAVLLPMLAPHLFLGIRRPQCNIMFYGVPGTGKTMLVEKVAAEAGLPLLCISPSAILSKWSGDSEKTLRAVFVAAAQAAPAIIFIDEIDSLAPARSAGDDLSSRRVLTELLIQMSNLTNKPGCLVYVMSCTNRMDDCDPALLRRFDRKIEVPLPDEAARQAFFLTTIQRPEIASALSEEEVAALAEQTGGCTGSDLSVICREAAMAPLRELMQSMQVSLGAAGVRATRRAEFFMQATLRELSHADFEAAIRKLKMQ